MENQSPHLSLRVPTPTQQNLSFCDATPKDIKYWLAHLPKANLGETARQLYQGLIELNQLVLPVEARLQLLELFRPEVHFVCAHLERHFLNQAIVLDERPRKIANLCQALQNHLAIGYKLIVVQEAPRNSRDRAQLLAVGIQRAIRSLCGPLIRASQLYCPVPEGLWLELHQLYQLASQRGVHRLAVRDELAKHTPGLSVEQAYLIPLLLGCARCNQMRQNNIARLAEVLEPWSQLLSIQSAALPGSLFIAVPQIDGPPRYRSLYPETQLANALGIDTQPLVELIREYLLQPEAERAKARLPLIEGVTLDLLQHLSSAWGDIAERTFQRTQGQGQLTLCIGMSALHYFLAGAARSTRSCRSRKRPRRLASRPTSRTPGPAPSMRRRSPTGSPACRWRKSSTARTSRPAVGSPITRRPTHRLTPPRTIRPTPCPSSTTAPAVIA